MLGRGFSLVYIMTRGDKEIIMNIPVVDQFTKDEQYVVKRLFMAGKTHTEIGDAMGKPRPLCKNETI